MERRVPTERARFAEAAGTRYPARRLHHPHWYALRTRSKHEKRTHRALVSQGVESFAAAAEVERVWADRTRRVAMPLFPGYIFVHVELSRVVEVLRAPGAVDFVRMRGVPTSIRGEEMEAVIRMARGVSRTGCPPKQAPYDDGLQPGRRVQVTEGPFEGMAGRLLSERGRDWVIIRLDVLRQARAVRIDRRRLAPLSEGRATLSDPAGRATHPGAAERDALPGTAGRDALPEPVRTRVKKQVG